MEEFCNLGLDDASGGWNSNGTSIKSYATALIKLELEACSIAGRGVNK
jgi:hypothetical protein